MLFIVFIVAQLINIVASATQDFNLPNIIVLIGDDIGWSGVSYHNASNNNTNAAEIRTPNIDSLVATGIELDQHYVYRFCSPSRSSFQSGRLPVHVNVQNVAPEVYNHSDVIGGYQGIAKPFTGIATKLKQAGYATHMIGKWDAGMATTNHTPIGRGYDSWLGYYHHANDYYTEGLPLKAIGKINICFNQYTDLWGPAQGPATNYSHQGTYEPEIFLNRTLQVIRQHPQNIPLFLVHAFHLVHTPLEVPEAYLLKFEFIDNELRQRYAAMTKYMDDTIGTILSALKKQKLYDNTLIVFLADNGGAIYNPGGGNNYPLKGGKMSDWQGGIRGTAFVSGGYIPVQKRGTVSTALIHISDWYTTFCSLANVDPTDTNSGPDLPVVDGIDVSAELFGVPAIDTKSSDHVVGSLLNQRELHISSQTLIQGRYKLITGVQAMSGWTGPLYPNNTGTQPTYIPLSWNHDCKDGELYDILEDETEHVNIATKIPKVLIEMQKRLKVLNKGNYNPYRGHPDPRACVQAKKVGGYYGPWIDLVE
jgi:arylsulfatase I/J